MSAGGDADRRPDAERQTQATPGKPLHDSTNDPPSNEPSCDDAPPLSADDEAFLDELFDAFSAAIAEARPVDLSAATASRPHLREQAAELLRLAQQVAPGRPVPSRRLAGYELLRELGHGATGTVFLARQVELGGRLVALKVLTPALSGAEESRRRFLAEASALARVRHPAVVAVHDVIDEGGFLALAMEWVEGGSLAEIIRRRVARGGRDRDASAHSWWRRSASSVARLERDDLAAGGSRLGSTDPTPAWHAARLQRLADVPMAEWAHWVAGLGVRVGRALAEVHRHGLVHRDCKPSNVLVDGDGDARLSDFGLVRDPEASLHTSAGTFLGTLAYAAPEQLRGEDARTHSDVWGLGATLYHALALRLPFSERSDVALLRRMEDGLGPRPLRQVDPRVPRDLETICARALQPRPEQRYASADALADDLLRWLDGKPIQARPVGPVERTLLLMRRNRRALVGAVAGAVLAVVVALGLVAHFIEGAELPGRVARHVDGAHLALLDADLTDRAWAAVTLGATTWERGALLARVQLAARSYDAALELDPEHVGARDERDVMALAAAVLGGAPAADVAARLAERLPLTVELAMAAGDTSAWQSPDDGRLASTSADDRRALGLLAWSCDDALLASRAWSGLARDQSDPLVDALSGRVLLLQGLAGAAYPRLLRALRAFPEVGALHVAAADAALLSGDVDEAERLLAASISCSRPARPREHERVAADLLWARGDGRAAFRAYEALLGRHLAANLRLGQYREGQGWYDRALNIYLSLYRSRPERLDLAAALVRTAEAWWRELDRAARHAALRLSLDDGFHDFGSLFTLLEGVHAARQQLAVHVPAPTGYPGDGIDAQPVPGAPFLPDGLARQGLDLQFVHAPPEGSLGRLADRLVVAERDLSGLRALSVDARDVLAAELLDAAADVSLAERFDAALAAATRAPRLPSLRLEAVRPVEASPGEAWQRVTLAPAGDLDGDGVDDLLLGDPSAEGQGRGAGRVQGRSGVDGSLLFEHRGARALDGLGASLVALGDLDGDGRPDLAAGAVQSELARPGYVLALSGADGAALWRVDGEGDGASFGNALAAPGDLDGDGRADVVVAASRESTDVRRAGGLYALAGADGRLLWHHAGPVADEFLGIDVALVGDVDGDGVPDLAAGGTRPFALYRGVARLVSGATGAGLLSVAPDARRPGFGVSVAAGGDVDEDGTPDLVVAEMCESLDLTGPGRLAWHSGVDGRLLHELKARDAGDTFGAQVNSLGDLDGDGRDELAVLVGNAYSPVPPAMLIVSGRGERLGELPGVLSLIALDAPSADGRVDVALVRKPARPGTMRRFEGTQDVQLARLSLELERDR